MKRFWLSALVFAVLSLSGSGAVLAQSDSAVEADIRAVIAEKSAPAEFKDLREKDQIIAPPIFRYRFTLKTTGEIRAISKRRSDAIRDWSKAMRTDSFADEFTHEIEFDLDGKKIWLPWQRRLVAPFNEELKGGGAISVRALWIGALRDEILFVALGYQRISLDR